MRYNIITVINSDYFVFGKIFVNSFYDNINLNNIHKLYIYDTGLSDEDKRYLSGFPQLEIVSSLLNTKFVKLHDKDWCKNVYSKTSFLHQVIEKDLLPTIMIDSDCLFLNDFFNLIPKKFDFVACSRGKKACTPYIASFFVINSIEKAAAFINDWHKEMRYVIRTFKESPALCKLISKGIYNVGFIPEELISFTGTDITEKVKIVHMKSTRELQTIEQRINQPHLIKYIEKYYNLQPIVTYETL